MNCINSKNNDYQFSRNKETQKPRNLLWEFKYFELNTFKKQEISIFPNCISSKKLWEFDFIELNALKNQGISIFPNRTTSKNKQC